MILRNNFFFLKAKAAGSKMKDFEDAFTGNEEVKTIREEVENFSRKFPMPGFDTHDL